MSAILRIVLALFLNCCLLSNSKADAQEPACPRGAQSKDQSGNAASAASAASREKQMGDRNRKTDGVALTILTGRIPTFETKAKIN